MLCCSHEAKKSFEVEIDKRKKRKNENEMFSTPEVDLSKNIRLTLNHDNWTELLFTDHKPKQEKKKFGNLNYIIHL